MTQTRIRSLVAVGALCLAMAGCGTTRALRDAWPEPEFYGGVRTDAYDIKTGGWGVFSVIDIPFSLVMDTVLVPVHAVLWAHQGLVEPEHEPTEFELRKTEDRKVLED